MAQFAEIQQSASFAKDTVSGSGHRIFFIFPAAPTRRQVGKATSLTRNAIRASSSAIGARSLSVNIHVPWKCATIVSRGASRYTMELEGVHVRKTPATPWILGSGSA